MAPRPSPQTSRVVDLFEILAANPGRSLSLAEISRQLDVHKASCHSMLAVLVGAGWLVRDPHSKTYQMGSAMLRLGAAASSRLPALDLARPAMAALALETGGHCIAFLVGEDHVTVAHQVRNVRVPSTPMAIGTELPTRPPYGAALAAWVGADQRDRWLDRVPADARERYRRALAATRRRGYAVGLHVLPDVRLQELASLIRAAEMRSGRLGDLADALTGELMHREAWFPAKLAAGRVYDVSHVDAPVFDSEGNVTLILSLLPVPSAVTGATVTSLGQQMVAATARLTEALGGAPAAGAAGGRGS
jgi:DNA-binding IclR family transcriptional regulator